MHKTHNSDGQLTSWDHISNSHHHSNHLIDSLVHPNFVYTYTPYAEHFIYLWGYFGITRQVLIN
jgi:hypothetical protein